MKLLNKLTIKNLKLNKKRTIVTIIGIILSTALIAAVAGMFFSARASLIEFEITEKGNYHVSFAEVPVEEIEKIELNRVVESYYLTKDIGYAKFEGIKNEYKPYVYVLAFTEASLENLGVNLTEGRLPEKETEILIPSHLYTNGGVKLEVGDKISLDIGTRTSEGEIRNQSNPYNPDTAEEIVDTKTCEYTVVGMIERISSEMEGYSAPGYTLVTYVDKKNISESANVYVRYTKKGLEECEKYTANILDVDEEAFCILHDSDALNALTDEEMTACYEKVSNAKYTYAYNSYLIELEGGLFNDTQTVALASAGMIVILIIIFTSVFCIKNSFDISITEKIRQYGMLSSIGATKKQIRKNVYYEATVLGVIGIPLGILLGMLAAFVLMHVCNYILADGLNIRLIFSFSWWAVLFAIVLSAVTIFLSARRSAVRAGKISPIQAIRNSGEIQIRSSKIKSPKWVKLFFGIGGEISYKNVKRSKKKYRTTVVSITICAAVFIALYSFINLAFDTIKMEYQSYDYNLNIFAKYEEDKYGTIDVEQIRGLEHVKDCSKMTIVNFLFETQEYSNEYLKIYPDAGNHESQEENTEYSYIYVLDEESYKNYVKELKLDYNEVKDKGILLNTTYQQMEEDGKYVSMQVPKYSFRKGDKIEGQIEQYKATSKDYEYVDKEIEIAAVTDKEPFGVSEYHYEAILVVNEEYGQQFLGNFYYQEIFIDSEDAAKTQEQIETLLVSSGASYTINNVEEVVGMMNSMYTLVAIFFYGFIAVIALIGVTTIFNTINTNMNLRRREFAMLKSVGMTKREFSRMIRLESFFYCTKSLLFGIPIGCVLSYLIYLVLATGDTRVNYSLPFMAILIVVVVVFALITVIMKYSLGKINGQNTIETIRNENI